MTDGRIPEPARVTRQRTAVLDALRRAHEPLSAIQDVNNWLGRSQFAADTRFGGSLLEFRIYDQPLTAVELAESVGFGPSPAFLRPPSAAAQEATGSGAP